MLHDLIGIHPSFAMLVLRVVLGIIFVVHGYPKLKGPAGVAGYLRSLNIPAPAFFAYVVGIVEFIGGLLLIVGFITRVAAILIAINMLVAILKVKGKTGLVSKPMEGGWIGGYEFDLALLTMAIVLVIVGAGEFSLDYVVFGAW